MMQMMQRTRYSDKDRIIEDIKENRDDTVKSCSLYQLWLNNKWGVYKSKKTDWLQNNRVTAAMTKLYKDNSSVLLIDYVVLMLERVYNIK